MWARAAWAGFGLLLVGIVAYPADVPSGGFSFLGIEKETKGCAVKAASGFVYKTSIDENEFSALYYLLIDDIGTNHLVQFVGCTCGTGGENNAFLGRNPLHLATVYEVVDLGCARDGVFARENIYISDSFKGRLATRILVLDDDGEVFSNLWSGIGSGITGTNPSSLTGDHACLCSLGAITGGLSLNGSSVSQLFIVLYESVGLRPGASHFNQLVLEDDSRNNCCTSREKGKNRSGANEYDRYSLALVLFTALGFATLSVGIHCIMYRRKALVAGIILQFDGSIVFLLSLGILIGYAATRGH